jgi:hypothetical protein
MSRDRIGGLLTVLVAFDIANLLVVGMLVLRQGRAPAASGFKRN